MRHHVTSELPQDRPLEDIAPPPPLLSIIIPTFNESENVSEVVRRLEDLLHGLSWEVIFVDDDSSDGTPGALLALAQSKPHVRLLHRIGRRGLASAVVEGILSTSAPYVAVMDADLQHDEKCILDMLDKIRTTDVEMVIGSRYLDGNSVENWQQSRQSISRIATRLAHTIIDAKITDPMSGFFMLRRDAFDRAVRRLSSMGYKILVDILVSAQPPLRVAEVPYVFRNRLYGESKLDSAIALEYLMLLLDKSVGRFLPVRFIMFMLVGGAGVFVHMLTLLIMNQGLQASFVESQFIAVFTAMTFNFFVNNALTYRDKRIKGARGLLRGLISFYAVCSVGAISNVGIAAFLFEQSYAWWVSGLAGILLGVVWNYAVSSLLTWRG
jgi:dolichol-phosphate mannosyltransferase